jgi:hypothetical protein
VPQLARVANRYGITVMSSGGFDSVTEKHKFAVDAAISVTIFPSGAHMCLAYYEDIEAFARALGGEVDGIPA